MAAYPPSAPPNAAAAHQFITERIRELPMFERLTPQQLTQVAAIIQIVRYDAGAVIFQQGQPAAGFILYAQGSGLLTRVNAAGYEERVGVVEPGIYIGESTLYYEEAHSVTLRAMQPSVILFLARRDLSHLLTNQPELRTNLRVPIAPGMASSALLGGERASGKRLFKGQRADETILHVFKRHPWAFLRWYPLPILIMMAALVGMALLAAQSFVWVAILGIVGIVLPGLLLVYHFFEWRNDFLIISDQRVIRVWEHLLKFENQINEIPLERVLEIMVEIPPADPAAHLLTYGTLSIKTAGEANNIVLPMMPKPKDIQQFIFAQRDRFHQSTEARKRQAIQTDIEKALGLKTGTNEAQTATPNAPVATADGERFNAAGLPFIRTRFLSSTGEIIYRRHSFVWFAHVFLPLLVVTCAPLLLIFSGLLNLPFLIAAALAAVSLIVGGIWLYLADWDWRNDMMILGSDRITLIHQRPLWLQNEEQIVRLAQVDNVMSEVTGLLDNLLNRGTIRISLLGSNEAKVFDKVYDPASIQAELSHRQAAFRQSQHTSDVRDQQKQMAEYIAVYHQAVTAAGTPPASTPALTFSTPPPGTPAPPPQVTQPVIVAPTQPVMPAPQTAALPRFEPPTAPQTTPAPSRQPHLPQRQQPFNSDPASLGYVPAAPSRPPDLPFETAAHAPGVPPPPPDLPELPPLNESIRPPRVPRRRPDDLPQ